MVQWAQMIEVNAYKYRYNGFEMYQILLNVFNALPILRKNRKSKTVDEAFIERIMLAVTEVNGCAVCSYAHTKMALESGFTMEEIESFFSGSDTYIKPEEAVGILFAQNYADNRGVFDSSTYKTLVNHYGEDKSQIILAAAKVMMAGNVIGLPMSAFSSRLKGKKYTNSSLLYEITMLFAPLVLVPLGALHALFKKLTHL